MKVMTKIMLGVFLLAMMLIQASVIGIAPTFQVIEINNQSETSEPTVIDGNSYFIVPPMNSNFPNVMYRNNENVVGNFQYTSRSATGYNTFSWNGFQDEDTLSGAITNPDTLYQSSNPFFPYVETSSKVVQIDNDNSMLQLDQVVPFSLHMDQEFTFFAEANVNYYGIFVSNDGFILDAYRREDSGIGNIFVSNSSSFTGFQSFSTKQSFFVFPSNSGTETTFVITFVSSVSTLMTLTPHPFDREGVHVEPIPVNSTFLNTYDQGNCGNVNGGSIDSSESRIKTITKLRLPVTGMTDYEIIIDVNRVHQSSSSLCPTGYIRTINLNSTGDFETVSGSIGAERMHFIPHESGFIDLFVEADGNLNHEYSLFFRSISPLPKPRLVDLPVNEPTTLRKNSNYLFTLDMPSLIAINWTSNRQNFDIVLDFYQNLGNSDFNWITNHGLFNVEKGNLITPNVNDLGTNWVYVPSGDYMVNSVSNVVDSYNMTFNIIPVYTLNPNLATPDTMDFTMNNYSLVAVDIVQNHKDYSMLNLSTSANQNLTLYYDVSAISKSLVYNSFLSTGFGIGNKQIFGNWVGNPVNNTKVLNNLKLTRFHDYAYLIHARYARNTTTLAAPIITNFTAQPLTVQAYKETNVDKKEGLFFHDSQTNMYQFDVNSNVYNTSDISRHIIPFSTSPNAIYNVSITLMGNLSATNDINASLTAFSVFSDSVRFMELFNSQSSSQTNTSLTYLKLILTDKEVSNVYITVDRVSINSTVFRNVTVKIIFTQVNVNELNFDLIDISKFEWNSIPDPRERVKRNILYEIEGYSPNNVTFDSNLVIYVFSVLGAVGISTFYISQRKK